LIGGLLVAEKSKSNRQLFGKTQARQYALYGLLVLSIIIFAYQAMPFLGASIGKQLSIGNPAVPPAAGRDNNAVNLDEITSKVLPKEGFTIDATWGSSVKDLVDAGALDPVKLEGILKNQYAQEMKPEWRKILAGEAANEKLAINNENAVFMMYVLWAFSKHNENAILTDSPLAKYFNNYDIGVGRAGYGDVKLLSLSPEQQAIAEKVALNSYRPCCGNSTGWPDCSHGFSALGLVEIMASQGYSEKEIFDAFVKFNSFWFPSTYIQNAVYFKMAEGKNWDEIDKEIVAGKNFSSQQGSYAVKKYLQDSGA